MKNNVWIITGSPMSGKDTFVNFCKSYDENILNYSSVDYIKWLCHTQLDIDTKNKTPKLRKFLSDFKRILTEYNDYPFQQCCRAIETLYPDQTIFIHIREQEEMDKIKAVYPQAKILYVEGGDSILFGNDSDDNQKEIRPDIVIYNDSTLGELNKTACWFVKSQIKG